MGPFFTLKTKKIGPLLQRTDLFCFVFIQTIWRRKNEKFCDIFKKRNERDGKGKNYCDSICGPKKIKKAKEFLKLIKGKPKKKSQTWVQFMDEIGGWGASN